MSMDQVAPKILVVMGVSGCGKSTVAGALHDWLGWTFQEGDSLHSPENVAKMRAGTPLDDADRAPWLASCAAWIRSLHEDGQPGILTCSSLKRSYRATLAQGFPEVWFVYLDVPQAVLQARLDRRQHHYMPSSLLRTQLDTLEVPGPDEQVIRVPYGPTDETVQAVVQALGSTVPPAG